MYQGETVLGTRLTVMLFLSEKNVILGVDLDNATSRRETM
jgi:hypothetical protein